MQQSHFIVAVHWLLRLLMLGMLLAVAPAINATALKTVITIEALRTDAADNTFVPALEDVEIPASGEEAEKEQGTVADSNDNDGAQTNPGGENPDADSPTGSAPPSHVAINPTQPVQLLHLPQRCRLRSRDLNGCLQVDRAALAQHINQQQSSALFSCCDALGAAQQRYGSSSCAVLSPTSLLTQHCGR